MNRDKIIAAIRDDQRMPSREPSELERALNNYRQMESDVARLQAEKTELLVSNRSLQAEVNMLREALERSDTDRIRLQSVASTFMGGIRALNATTLDLVNLAIKNGVEAATAAKPEEKAQLDEAGVEARDIIERIEPATSTAAKLAPNEFRR